MIFKKSLGDLKHHAEDEQQRQYRLMSAAKQLAADVGIAPAYAGLGVSRASYYRKQKPKPKPKPARALSNEERQQVLDVLHSERFVDQSP